MSDLDEKKAFGFGAEDVSSDAALQNQESDFLDPPMDLTFGEEKENEEEDYSDSVREESCDEVEESVEEAKEEEIPEWIGEYVSVTDAHFQNLRALIKYTKTKDESIYKLSNELQKYREDYCAKTFKSIGMAIISFREDCRKSLSDILKYQYDSQKVDKYLDFLADDYFEMLSNVGIEEDDDIWLFNGSPIRQTEEEKEVAFVKPFKELEPAEEETYEVPIVKNTEDLVAFLKMVEDSIKISLEKNEVLDKCLKAYIEFSFNLEKNLVKVLVLPAVRSLVTIGFKLKDLVDDSRKELTDDNCNEKYTACLEYLTNALEDVLLSGGVTIDTDVRDEFDPKKDRLLKTVMTDNASLDRKIASVHTECYMMNEKVIYPSKVDVYKFAPKAE